MVCVCGQWRKGAGGGCKWNLQTLKFSFRYQRKQCFHSLHFLMHRTRGLPKVILLLALTVCFLGEVLI